MFLILKLISNLIYKLVKTLNVGSGYTLPGHLILKWYSNFLSDSHIKFKRGIVLVSGTNGKTTTSLLITHLLENSGFSVVHNKSGSNLMRGIVSAILLDRSREADFGVFEVDEFSLPDVLKQLSLTNNNIYLVVLNLSRDQLDRYGETDIIFDRWVNTFAHLKKSPKLLIYNNDQSEFKSLSDLKVPSETFDGDDNFLKRTKLFGLYNAYNVNAAVTLCAKLKVNLDSLSTFEVAYGRGETIVSRNGREFKILLAKNPASFNANLQVVLTPAFANVEAILFVLNDNIPDGRDVSWIYDIDPVFLEQVCKNKTIYVAGTRYLDMVVRLQYAGVTVLQKNISENLSKRLQKIPEKKILILPNYSAMLQVRKNLTGRAIL